MRVNSIVVAVLLCAAIPAQRTVHEFERIQLNDDFYSEGATFGDINGDGVGDVIAGPFWYAGPGFEERHEIYEPAIWDVAGYSKNFFAFIYDFNRDGANDIFFIGFPGEDASWFENPQGQDGHWIRHQVFDVVDNESPTFQDVTGDGLPEMILQSEDRLGYASPDWSDPAKPWVFHPISATGLGGKFTHGLGIGDVDGDGRTDILTRVGWWRQPTSLQGDPEWQHSAHEFGGRGGAQIYVYDVDGDGDNDVISSWNAHGYGLYWYEHVEEGGAISFVQRKIMGELPEENPYGLVIGNLHAIDLVDMDGDGVKDIVVGSRYWAHNGRDLSDRAPALVYWLQLLRPDQGKGVQFAPHEIDDDSGVGTQVVASDVNGDGLPDVVVGNKKGTFVHMHSARTVTNSEYYEDQRRSFTKILGLSARIDRTGDLPLGANGQPLNLDFESGDLGDWTATGEAFAGMPNEGDTIQPRREDSRSDHEGEFWIGTYEVGQSDSSQGTLTSASFEVTHPFASFLVGGGRADTTRVEMVRADTDDVFYTASGMNRENMRPLFLDLSENQGQHIYIRLVDEASGGWGHINFDDFRFHVENPTIRKRAEEDEQAQAEGYLPLEAASRMTVPEGFQVELVAGEPELHQPIAFCLDDQARLWVAEAHSYPMRREDGTGQDKLLVFEDTDGDGTYDKRTVFADNLNLVSGLEVGFGGVWVGAAPYLMFIPDQDDDLVPDGEPEILLDGWGYQDTHETLNAFNWGPDGWLYGCHGVFTHSRVGAPGTPDDERVPLNAAVWRYHPTRHEFEVFAWGTSNPWGVDFDDHGEAFVTACVIPHLFHMIQGGRYHRQAGQHFNRYVFDDIKTIADHLHYLGEWAHSGNGVSESVGGGHAHCGAMIYLGDAFPAEYRGAMFMSNIHGNRINVDHMAASGSGFTASHGDDFLLANDPWFRGINLRYGPDGNVFMIDWYDEQACHLKTPEVWDRTNGRLYKVSYGEPRILSVDVRAMSDMELVTLQLHDNDWYVRMARRVLQERGGNPAVHAALTSILTENPDITRKLRALWALHVTGGLSEELALAQMNSADEYLRAWSVQLTLEDGQASFSILEKLASMAQIDPSPVVRRYLASGMQRLPLMSRWTIAEHLTQHEEDRDDQNLPLMYWYGIEPMVTADPQRALRLAFESRIPLLSRYIVRRMASSTDHLDTLVEAIGEAQEEELVGLILEEMNLGLATAGDVEMPFGWQAVSPWLMRIPGLRDRMMALALTFGDASVAPYLRDVLMDKDQELVRREDALNNLIRIRDPQLVPVLQQLIEEPAMAGRAIRGLASYNDAGIPELLVARFGTLGPLDQVGVVNTLSSRPSYAVSLLNAILDKRIPSTVLDSATARRQMIQLGNDEVNELMTAAWGRSALPNEDKRAEIDRYKSILTPEFLATADLSNGRTIFSRTCMNCHQMFGTGTDIAPDLTGSDRANLEYLLSNVVDPDGEVGNQYLSTLVTLKDGRLLLGMITDRTEQSLTIRDEIETVIVNMSEVAVIDGELAIQQSQNSLMAPELLTPLSNEEVRDLVGYMASPVQVPILASSDNLALFFDGESLANWQADPAIWSVEDGELVGRTTTGLPNNVFAKSQMLLDDFRLILQVKLVGNQGNSGIQFRSEAYGEGEMRGYQADIGADWWGKLYEENGRGLLFEEPGDSHVREGEWNTYEILAVGDRIQTSINGELCVDIPDPDGAARGMIGLQVHSGDPTEVRFRNFQMELNPEPVLKTAPSSGGGWPALLVFVIISAGCVVLILRASRKVS